MWAVGADTARRMRRRIRATRLRGRKDLAQPSLQRHPGPAQVPPRPPRLRRAHTSRRCPPRGVAALRRPGRLMGAGPATDTRRPGPSPVRETRASAGHARTPSTGPGQGPRSSGSARLEPRFAAPVQRPRSRRRHTRCGAGLRISESLTRIAFSTGRSCICKSSLSRLSLSLRPRPRRCPRRIPAHHHDASAPGTATPRLATASPPRHASPSPSPRLSARIHKTDSSYSFLVRTLTVAESPPLRSHTPSPLPVSTASPRVR